ncbi:type IVB secretion system protein IcmH/DotU [Methylocaldum sp.]|uniref:type IVB secretion system protein IcmH/DotU n=1 Tax=Methylocaldum sp. TaxID=1969727 RepID=UPI002D45CD30|nr:type IVB secretion system protein IcmH/DotU [Methylocaldum sp.]HYE34288.1 type IVB secretion system protein IcmH/DotU [Methylocaldum sp.]
MNSDDPFAPFGDEDKTIIRPTPGGRRRSSPAPVVAAPEPPIQIQVPDVQLDARRQAVYGENPLVTAALSLLSLVSRLRNTAVHQAVGELQQQLVNEMRSFENRVLQQGVSQEQARIASYALCTLLDETVLNTPWGAQSQWGHQSLLVIFHKEAWGGEKFFQFLERLVRQPAQNLNLIELFWLCLSLGLEGKYRIMQNGVSQLEHVRVEVYQLIQRLRGDFERDLSVRWQGLRDVRNPIIRYVPLWVIAAGAAALLVLVYLGFAFAINSASDPVARDLFALAKDEVKLPVQAATPVPVPAAPTPKLVAKTERFKRVLAWEITRNMVEVVDDRILRIRNSFDSGSDRVKSEFVPMFAKIAKELETGGDGALVTGHTDNKPIFSARFPSNFDLSAARAKHVAAILESSAALQGRIRFEGRADYEPLVPNDSADHRAMNRRVDILIQ